MKPATRPILYIFGGLPGVGKSTLASLLVKTLKATYLRIDTIEQAIKDNREVPLKELGPEGYFVGYELARENLENGMSVIADSVNSLAISRKGWLDVALESNAIAIQIEVFCSDKKEHRHRVETRSVSVKNLKPPTWEAVCYREHEPWLDANIRIDTASKSSHECLNKILGSLDSSRSV